MGILKKVGKAFGSVINAVLKPVTWLLSALIDLPKTPKGLEQASDRSRGADVRVNEVRLGDVKPVCYGLNRTWPPVMSMPYVEFQGHDQIFNAYLILTVGHAQVLDVRLGDTPAQNFPGFESEVCLPGVAMTLVRPNVYTNPDVSGIELIGGIETADDDGKITVQRRTTDTLTFISATSRITSLEDGFFDDFQRNDLIRFNDTGGANDSDFVIQGFEDDGRTVIVFPAPNDDTETDCEVFVARRWTGWFYACPPGSTVDTIAIDIVFASLFDRDDPNDTRSCEVEVEYRPVNDAGVVLGAATSESFTVSSNVAKTRRYTQEIALSGAMRPEVRIRRVTYEQNDPDDPSSAAQWVGLKGYIVPLDVDDPANDADSTRIAIRVRSSGMLAAQSERSVSVLHQRLLPIYDSGGWTEEQETRSPAWAFADWIVNQSAGAITLDKLDIDALVESAATASANSDTFDAEFNRQVGLWEGAKSILRVARSKPILDPLTQLYSIYRDEPSDPVQLFCDGFNARCGDDAIRQPDADTVTGVQVRFTDPLIWSLREGPIVGTDEDPRIVDLFGATTWDACWREAHYEFRDLTYRTQSLSLDTEMEGLLPRHGKRVLVASAIKGWGHGGEVIDWDEDELTLKVRPAPIWTTGMDHYVYLQDDDGTPVGPINVTQGIAAHYLVLESDPGLIPRIAGGWKTLFAFGHDGDTGTSPDAPRIAIVMERQATGPRSSTLQLLFDHPYVHEDPGPAPDDPYSLTGTIPSLPLTGLTAEIGYSGILLDEEGQPILRENGTFIEREGETGAVVINVDWDDTSGASYYSMRWTNDAGTTWHNDYTGIASETSFGVTANGTYQIRVKAISGSYVGPEASTSIVITGF